MKHAFSLCLVGFVIGLTAPAEATTVIRISLDQMTQSSDVILYGQVVSSTPIAVNGNPRHIRTDVHIRITQQLKGRAMKDITLQLPGGTLGDYAMKIPGMPTFKAGGEVVLFLEKTAQNWALTGLGQGKYSVYRTKEGKQLVRRQLDGVHFVGYDAQGRFKALPQAADKAEQTLSSLLADVKFALAKAKPGK